MSWLRVTAIFNKSLRLDMSNLVLRGIIKIIQFTRAIYMCVCVCVCVLCVYVCEQLQTSLQCECLRSHPKNLT